MGGRKDCFNAKIGTSFEASRWLSLDPCGLAGITMSTSVHIYAYIVLASYMIEGSLFATALFLLVYTPIVILALSSLYMAFTTNPGAVPLGARPLVTVKRAASGEMVANNASNGSRQRAIRRCHKCNDNFKHEHVIFHSKMKHEIFHPKY